MDPFNFKRISDPVYGTVGLSELEIKVINTRAFLRLRNVKQLGLAYYVFPGLDYSRFAHSIGCCHIVGRILDSITRTESRRVISDNEIQLYRLAGLLHDIGHYPFSHATEEALKAFYAGDIVEWPEQHTQGAGESGHFKHERVGREVLSEDSELKGLLEENGISPEQIWSVFMRTNPNQPFANLVSSDLDADRIDYLLRTAHHSGLPYGTVDLDYLISQMRLDGGSKICITQKAVRAADHMLLCRYFDYLQVSFHKTVAAFELVLKDVISALLRDGFLSCSKQDVTHMISDGRWYEFDDIHLLELIREYSRKSMREIDKLKAEAILQRNPPRMVFQKEFLEGRKDGVENDRYTMAHRLLSLKKNDCARDMKIEGRRWYIWSRKMELTKVGSHASSGSGEEQAVRVLNSVEAADSVPIATCERSLMSVMSNYANYMIRLYVLLKPDELGRRSEIEDGVRKD